MYVFWFSFIIYIIKHQVLEDVFIFLKLLLCFMKNYKSFNDAFPIIPQVSHHDFWFYIKAYFYKQNHRTKLDITFNIQYQIKKLLITFNQKIPE